MNFNESLSKNVAYNNIKSHQKSGLHPLSRKHDFGKMTGIGGSNGPFSLFTVNTYLKLRHG